MVKMTTPTPPNKKAKKRLSTNLIRYNYNVVSDENFQLLTNKLQSALDFGAKRGEHIVVGVNSISKALERQKISVIVVCNEAPKELLNHIIDGARLYDIPLVCLVKASSILCPLLKVRSLSCFALTTPACLMTPVTEHEPSTDSTVDGGESTADDSLVAGLDGLRDFLVSLAS